MLFHCGKKARLAVTGYWLIAGNLTPRQAFTWHILKNRMSCRFAAKVVENKSVLHCGCGFRLSFHSGSRFRPIGWGGRQVALPGIYEGFAQISLKSGG